LHNHDTHNSDKSVEYKGSNSGINYMKPTKQLTQFGSECLFCLSAGETDDYGCLTSLAATD